MHSVLNDIFSTAALFSFVHAPAYTSDFEDFGVCGNNLLAHACGCLIIHESWEPDEMLSRTHADVSLAQPENWPPRAPHARADASF